MLFRYRFRRRMDRFSPLQTYSDQGYRNRRRDSSEGSDLDFAFDTRLRQVALASTRHTGHSNKSEAHQGRRYPGIANEEVTVWRPRDSDEGCHLVSGSRHGAGCAREIAMLKGQEFLS